MANAYRHEAVTQMGIVEELQSSLATVDKERAAAAKAKADQYQARFFELCDDFSTSCRSTNTLENSLG